MNPYAKIFILLTIIITGLGYGYVDARRGMDANSSHRVLRNKDTANERSINKNLHKNVLRTCTKNKSNYYSCSSPSLLAQAAKIKTWHIYEELITARITKYGRGNSCDLGKRRKICRTAIGREPVAGTTVACPKRYSLKTHIRIMGHDYTCEDRYADWVQEKYGDTFDIFTEETEKEQRQFGAQTLPVTIIYSQ